MTGIYGLNVPNFDLDTTGDWHASSLDWSKAEFKESDSSPLGLWGISQRIVKPYPFCGKQMLVANHLRSLVDIIADGYFTLAGGMRRDYLGTDKYNQELFTALDLLQTDDNWEDINSFMCKEFGNEWKDHESRSSSQPA